MKELTVNRYGNEDNWFYDSWHDTSVGKPIAKLVNTFFPDYQNLVILATESRAKVTHDTVHEVHEGGRTIRSGFATREDAQFYASKLRTRTLLPVHEAQVRTRTKTYVEVIN